MPDGAIIAGENAQTAPTAREVDVNGFITIAKNPITRVGVFPYLGKNLPGAADPDRVYMVLRPPEEVGSPETLASFKGMPIIDEHTMLGQGFPTAAEEKGIHGTTLDDVVMEDGVVYAPVRIFSETLKRLIDAGKKALSVGYRCVFEKTAGVWNGQAYDYVQRKIRGNHLALVPEARMGKDIAVLDHWAFDSFDLNNKELFDMADPKTETETDPKAKKEGKDEGGDKEMTLSEVTAALAKIMPAIEKINQHLAGGDKSGEGLDADEKAKEEAEKKKAEDQKAAMDAAIATAVDQRMADVLARVTPTAIRAEMRRADDLAKQVSTVVGTFDHSEMTEHQVAAYGCEKLGLKPTKGQEIGVLTGYLEGRKAGAPKIGFAQDSKTNTDGGLLGKTLAAHQ